MGRDEIDNPPGFAGEVGPAHDRDANRRVRENDLVRELGEVTARHPQPPDDSQHREEPHPADRPR